jgi:hypothetical protein
LAERTVPFFIELSSYPTHNNKVNTVLVNTKLPSKIINQNTKIDQQVRANDEKGKRNMKINADKSANARS